MRPSRSPVPPSQPVSERTLSGFWEPTKTPGLPEERLIRCSGGDSARCRMPHATPQLDWELARSITTRLLESMREVHFSYAKQNETAEARPSRLIVQIAGEAKELAPDLVAPACEDPLTVTFQDFSRIPFLRVRSRAALLSLRAVAVPLQGLRHSPPRRSGLGASPSRPHTFSARTATPFRTPLRLGGNRLTAFAATPNS